MCGLLLCAKGGGNRRGTGRVLQGQAADKNTAQEALESLTVEKIVEKC